MGLPSRLLLVALAVVASRRQQGAAGPAPPPPPPPSPPWGAQCLNSTCFALFWEARSFPAASDACQGGGGHLMTVRSTVAAEAIELLFSRGRSGTAWLGLHLPEGSCVAQAGKRLRGFEWVAGGERSDYVAWAGGGGGGDDNGTRRHPAATAAPACGPLCVAVTRERTWRERPCQAPADGFLCEYNYPEGTCAPLSPPPPATATYLTPFGAREADLAALPPGTRAELLPDLGGPLECSPSAGGWARARPGAWDCRLANGGCEGQCRWDGEGRPSCACPEEGSVLREEDGRSCRSVCAARGCQHFCVAQGQAGVCLCSEGYALGADGRSCVDVDDCQAAAGPPCEQECLNTPGGFECRCFPGYQMVEGKCQDSEEDAQRCFDLDCQHECARVGPRLACVCFEGYVAHPEKPHECVLFCNQTECPSQCDPHTGESCECPDGFILDDKEDGSRVCADIDECGSDYCGHLMCLNTPGGYSCLFPEEGDDGGEDSSSGEPEPPSLPPPVPPKEDGIGQGVVVGIAVGVASVLVLFFALLFYSLKKQARERCARTGKGDYTCQQSETDVVLQHVSLNSSSSREKM